MRNLKNRAAAAIGVVTLGTTGLVGIALSSDAEAAARDGKCETGEFCYNFNSNLKGSWSDFRSSVGDYGTNKRTCYVFKSAGNGKGQCIKNNAGGYWNRTNKTVTVFYNSGHNGSSVKLKPGAKGKLPSPVYNENASHRIGGGGGNNPAPPPSGVRNMSDALYSGSDGRLTTGFDGYQNTPGRHEGIDFAKGKGSRVNSLVDGYVTRATTSDGLGTIAIYVPKADKTVIYLHARTTVRTGQKVTKGQQVAVESALGTSAVHTHVEMRPGKQTHASKSVNDYTLDNPNPTTFWQSQGYRVK